MDSTSRLKQLVITIGSRLVRSSECDIKRLQSIYPKLPESYIAVLRDVGSGTFGDSAFCIYGGPLEADEIFDSVTAERFKDYLFLGDDFSGWMIAYDTASEPWTLKFFNHDEPTEVDENDLAEFLFVELSRK